MVQRMGRAMSGWRSGDCIMSLVVMDVSDFGVLSMETRIVQI